MADDDEEDLSFNVEDIQKIIRDNIELILGGNIYSHTRCPIWISLITDKTLSRLVKLSKPFKYISSKAFWSLDKSFEMNFCRPSLPPLQKPDGSLAHSAKEKADLFANLFVEYSRLYSKVRITITQKNGAGLHTAATYFWDTATDGTCTVRWENKYMYCIVNMWGLALQL